MSITTWEGKKVDTRTAKMLDEVDRKTTINIRLTQGSYNTSVSLSAGTHSKGGAVDISTTLMTEATALKLVKILRQTGFAAWLRPRTKYWQRHIHAIAIQPGGRNDQGVLSSSAWNQVKEYYDAGDGLVGTKPDPHKDLGVRPITFEDSLKKSSYPLPSGHYYATSGTNSHNGRSNLSDYSNVQKIQKRVRVSPTGYYGPYTRARVIAWQKWKRISGTGRVGRVTWDAMFPPS